MRKLSEVRLPSPSMLVALTALFVALGGTGYAASRFSNSSTGDTAADKALIKQLAPTLSVASARTAGSAASARTAASATHATTAGSARAVAFAHMNPGGTLDTANSKNVSSIKNGDVGGVFCLDVTVPVSNMVAMPDTVDNGNTDWASGMLSSEGGSIAVSGFCGSGYNAVVLTNNSNDGFWVTFN